MNKINMRTFGNQAGTTAPFLLRFSAMNSGTCLVRLRLLGETEKILERILELTAAQLEAIRQPDQIRLMTLDKELEERVGEKERLFGALRQHRSEHGC